MAKATFIPAVTETKTIEVEPAKVTLELTVKEVQHLHALTGACNSTDVSFRWGSEVNNMNIHESLGDALQAANAAPGHKSNQFLNGSIRYKEEA